MSEPASVGEITAQGRFVSVLESLSQAQIGVMRRAVGKPLGADVAVYDLFNEMWRPLRRKLPLPKTACYLAASLYPWNPLLGGRGSMGASLRTAMVASYGEVGQNGQRRFLALVWAKGEALDNRLADAVRYLARSKVPVDWRRLLGDLAIWYEPGEPVQRNWMVDFFSGRERSY